MLDKDFIERKIKLIQEDLGRLDQLGNYSFKKLAADFTKMSAVERLLEKIIMRAIDINQHLLTELGRGNERIRGYEDTFLALASLKVYPADFAEKIAPSAGLRNYLVHEYNGLDQEIVYKSIADAISQYTRYCDYILKFFSSSASR